MSLFVSCNIGIAIIAIAGLCWNVPSPYMQECCCVASVVAEEIGSPPVKLPNPLKYERQGSADARMHFRKGIQDDHCTLVFIVLTRSSDHLRLLTHLRGAASDAGLLSSARHACKTLSRSCDEGAPRLTLIPQKRLLRAYLPLSALRYIPTAF